MRVPTNQAHAELEIKKSKFIADTCAVTTESEARQYIAEKRASYPDASHVVYAWILGDSGSLFGMSDDREPRNTAGRPVIEVLKGSGLTNILLTVVRYFGGTKLGTGGLVHAYSGSAKEVLALQESELNVLKVNFSLMLRYDLYDQAKIILINHHAGKLSEEFATEVTIKGELPESSVGSLQEALQDLSSGKATLRFD